MEKIRLKAARIRAGLRQVELAKMAGVSPGMLSRYECGWLVPREDTAGRIACALGITPQEVLEFHPAARTCMAEQSCGTGRAGSNDSTAGGGL